MKNKEMILFASLVLSFACLTWVPAQQPQKPSIVEELIKEGDAAYQRQEYAKSAKLLQEAIAKGAREEEFQKEMPIANSTSRWLYASSGGNGRPVDLGYWMGYKISQAHYQNSTDKKQAVRDILIVKDCQQLLKASRYAEKFATASPVQK